MITVKIGRHEVLFTLSGDLRKKINFRTILHFICLKFRFLRLSLKCSFNYMHNKVITGVGILTNLRLIDFFLETQDDDIIISVYGYPSSSHCES